MPFQSLNSLNSLGSLGGGNNAPFNPNSIAGLALWFDATRNVYSDAGTTLATNGQTVQQWNDLSTSAKNLTQASAGARPTYNTNVKNGLPAITFDGVSNKMTTGAMTLNQPAHAFCVVDQVTYIVDGGLYDGVNNDQFTVYQTSGAGNLQQYSGTDTGNLQNLAIGTYGVLECQFNGPSSFSRVNNGSKLVTTKTLTGTPGGLVLGIETTEFNSNVIYGEFIVYNVALSDSDAAKVSRYLGAKWGITVS